jgi:hypothetical protein
MANIAKETLEAFLAEVGRRNPQEAHLYLIGGSALSLLGNPRPTLDIDYVGDDLRKDELQQSDSSTTYTCMCLTRMPSPLVKSTEGLIRMSRTYCF